MEIKGYLGELHDKDIISDPELERLTSHYNQPGIPYGLCKVHKKTERKFPPFRPILSAIRTPSYELAKFLVPILSEHTENKYVSEDSFPLLKITKYTLNCS